MNGLQQCDPEIYNLIKQEERRQKDKIRLIASENYVSARSHGGDRFRSDQ